LITVDFVKLAHPKHVLARESLQSRLGSGEKPSKLIDHTRTPFGGLDFSADGLPDLPIEVDQLDIDRLEGALAGGLDEAKHFIEIRRWRHARGSCAEIGHDFGELQGGMENEQRGSGYHAIRRDHRGKGLPERRLMRNPVLFALDLPLCSSFSKFAPCSRNESSPA